MFNLKDQIVLVTGGTRGIGKGIVLALSKLGAIVYFTGRTEKEQEGAVLLAGSISSTEQEVKEAGGTAIGMKCDHTVDEQVKEVVDTIIQRHGKIDILVNNVWGGYEYYNDGTEFWKEREFWTVPLSRWDKMFQAGVRAYYVASSYVAPVMAEKKKGLIINLSFWSAQRNDRGVAYGVSKAATNKMTETMAYELQPYNVSTITIYPGLVRTESVMKAAEYFDLSNSESPEFIGMAIAALASDEEVIKKSGTIQIAAKVALEYGFTDIDGKQPVPLTVETC
jgi:NAD(P)-dependent dehydrogenase (short-subunit alcohol dehydrogenase family)